MIRLPREERLRALEDVNTVVRQIDAAYEAGEPERDIKCPRCGASLLYTKAVNINGHRNATCPNQDCGFGFCE